MSTEKGYKRCGVCDYCELSDEFSQKRTFNFDKKEDFFVCNVCSSEVGEALSEFGYDDHTEKHWTPTDNLGNSWRAEEKTALEKKRENFGNDYKVPEERQTQKPNKHGRRGESVVTLPGVTGINEGPKINVDKWEPSEYKQDSPITEKDIDELINYLENNS